MTTTPVDRPRRRGTTLREGETVTFLELFFDLVLVLALTQATAIMAAEPTWAGLAKGMLVLGVMWWSWVGYAWLTSVVDPEEGATRIVMFVAMAALLVAALCLPEAFGDLGLLFAVTYGFVRFSQIGLFYLASADERTENLRASVISLGIGTLISVSLLAGASFADGWVQGLLWLTALLLDMLTPYLFGSEGWKVSPRHFAERHGLILIIALGESIVAIGIGAEGLELGVGEVLAAVLGVGVACAMWWLYFDVVQKVAEHRLANAAVGKEQNEIARDSYSYLHFPMVAGIVLVALGLKKTIGHVEDHLYVETATAMFGGMALYLFAHVAFRWRNVHSLSTQRIVAALACLALIPVAVEIPALASLVLLFVLAWALVVYETIRFREARDRMRHQLAEH